MGDGRIRTIGRYEVEREIGRGGMAVVYKAFDPRLERAVAIKLIQSGAFGSNIFGHIRERFEREAKALAKLDHPNIVKVLDYGEHEGAPYLVMDYLEGATLKEVRKPLRVETAVRLLRPIAEALDYVHRHGLLHRDVKPSNIMITKEERVVLTDFGIAKWIEDEGELFTLTGTGVGIGTPEYMAPEQGRGKQLDGRSDAYSLTIVFYELITGKKPYGGDTPLDVLMNQVSEPIPDPREIVPELSESVKRFLDRAMAKKPEDRYPTMRDYLRDLDGLRLQALAGRAAKPTGTGEIRTELRSEAGTDSSVRFGRTDLQKVCEAGSGGQTGDQPVQPVQAAPQAAPQAAGQAEPQQSTTGKRKRGWLIGALAAIAVIAGLVGLRMGLPRGTEVASGTGEAALTIEAGLGETQTALAQFRTDATETAGTSFRLETESGLNAALTAAAESIMALERRTTQGAEEARAAQQATAAEIERRATEVSQLAADVAKTEQANAEAAQRRESELAATSVMLAEIAVQQTAAATQANAAAETAQAVAQITATETAQAQAQNPYADLQVGDVITFGSYEQDNNEANGPEPIEWRVLTAAAESIMALERRTTQGAEEARAAQQATAAEIERRATEVSQLATDVAKTEQANAEAAQRRESESAATMAMQVEIAVQQTAAAAQANAAAETAQAVAKAAAVETEQAIAQIAAVRTEQAIAQMAVAETVQALAATETAQAKARNPYADVQVGDIITFGSYEQDNNPSNGPEPIQWQVLDVSDGSALIVSEYALDVRAYNNEWVNITWAECTLRGWLNGEFYDTAFNEEEKGRIALTKVENADNPRYGTEGGEDTEDRIFLLSLEEAKTYFEGNEDRRAFPTEYAIAQDVYVNDDLGTVWWWLRSPGFDSDLAADVDPGGSFGNGDFVRVYRFAVRPALRLKMTP